MPEIVLKTQNPIDKDSHDGKFLRWLFRLLWRVNLQGEMSGLHRDKVSNTPNHVSFLDGILLYLFLPVKPVFAIDIRFADHWMLNLLRRWVDVVALDPARPTSVKHLINTVNQGRSVVIFPEGRITVTGTLMKIYSGAGWVAAWTQAQVVPVRIEGAEYTLFSRFPCRRRLFPKIRISVLPPTRIPMSQAPQAFDRRAQAGEHLAHIMREARVAARPRETLFQAFFSAANRYGWGQHCLEDIDFAPDNYRSLLRKILGISRMLETSTRQGEKIGLLLPNASVTAATLLAAVARGRVPAMLNYAAGVHDTQIGVDAAELTTLFTSRQFLEQGKLWPLVEGITGVSWIFLEDLQDSLKLRDKLWILGRLLAPVLAKDIIHRYQIALIT